MSGTETAAMFVSTATRLPREIVSVARRLTTRRETTTAEGYCGIWERYFFLDDLVGKKTLRRLSLRLVSVYVLRSTTRSEKIAPTTMEEQISNSFVIVTPLIRFLIWKENFL